MYSPRCSYGVRLPYILTLSVPHLSSRTFEPRVHCAHLNMKSGCADVSPRIFIRKEFYQMKTETVILDPARPDVTLTSYILPGCRPAMIVLPGGGFCELASYEGDPIAVHFMAKGFNAFVLRYTIGQPQSFFPRPLTDVSAAIVNVRKNAEKYCIDPDGIFVEGTSAGGYLAGAIGAMWHRDFAKSSPDMEYGANRPNGVILSYAVTSTAEGIRNPCMNNLVTDEYGEEAVSIERHVDEKSVPAFIWHSFLDGCVDPRNALVLADSYVRAKVPCELHLYSDGAHGIGLGVPGEGNSEFYPRAHRWADESAEWALGLYAAR